MTSLEAVSRIWGEPIEVRGDSVRFRIDSWRGGTAAGPRTEVSAVLPMSDPQVGFFQNHFSWTRNLVWVAIVIGLVALSIGQADIGF
jgi:hypothetical protein